MQLKRIVVPLDFSETSDHAFAYALELARMMNADVLAIHAYQLPYYLLPDGAFMLGPKEAAALSSAAQQGLDAAVHKQSAEGVLLGVKLLEGPAHTEILRFAEDRNADLIVMGTHGRTGIAHALMGSVTERIVRTSRIPVLTVPPADRAR